MVLTCQWLEPVEYDSYARMAKVMDRLRSLPDISDFLLECPIAGASLQLDWSLIEGKSNAGRALERGVPYDLPISMPVKLQDPNQEVVMILCDHQQKDDIRSAKPPMQLKPRAGGPFLIQTRAFRSPRTHTLRLIGLLMLQRMS